MHLLLNPFIGILSNGLALYGLTKFVEGVQYTGGLTFFVIGGLVLGLINLIVKPLIKLISLPFVILTGGLFLVVINAGVLWFLQYLIEVIKFRDVTFAITGGWTNYLLAAVILGLINWGLSLLD